MPIDINDYPIIKVVKPKDLQRLQYSVVGLMIFCLQLSRMGQNFIG